MEASLTVFFEDPFWVGVFERFEDGMLSVCKVTFGPEPKDCEILTFILRHYYELQFSPSIEAESRKKADNPKRRLRNAKNQLEHIGIGTKSQQALQMQHEALKAERQRESCEQRDAEEQQRFALKQKKRKEKHKGH